jgi:hypothetical protein
VPGQRTEEMRANAAVVLRQILSTWLADGERTKTDQLNRGFSPNEIKRANEIWSGCALSEFWAYQGLNDYGTTPAQRARMSDEFDKSQYWKRRANWFNQHPPP